MYKRKVSLATHFTAPIKFESVCNIKHGEYGGNHRTQKWDHRQYVTSLLYYPNGMVCLRFIGGSGLPDGRRDADDCEL